MLLRRLQQPLASQRGRTRRWTCGRFCCFLNSRRLLWRSTPRCDTPPICPAGGWRRFGVGLEPGLTTARSSAVIRPFGATLLNSNLVGWEQRADLLLAITHAPTPCSGARLQRQLWMGPLVAAASPRGCCSWRCCSCAPVSGWRTTCCSSVCLAGFRSRWAGAAAGAGLANCPRARRRAQPAGRAWPWSVLRWTSWSPSRPGGGEARPARVFCQTNEFRSPLTGLSPLGAAHPGATPGRIAGSSGSFVPMGFAAAQCWQRAIVLLLLVFQRRLVAAQPRCAIRDLNTAVPSSCR